MAISFKYENDCLDEAVRGARSDRIFAGLLSLARQKGRDDLAKRIEDEDDVSGVVQELARLAHDSREGSRYEWDDDPSDDRHLLGGLHGDCED